MAPTCLRNAVAKCADDLEARRQCHLSDAHARVGQQLLCPLDPPPDQVAVRWLAQADPEAPVSQPQGAGRQLQESTISPERVVRAALSALAQRRSKTVATSQSRCTLTCSPPKSPSLGSPASCPASKRTAAYGIAVTRITWGPSTTMFVAVSGAMQMNLPQRRCAKPTRAWVEDRGRRMARRLCHYEVGCGRIGPVAGVLLGQQHSCAGATSQAGLADGVLVYVSVGRSEAAVSWPGIGRSHDNLVGAVERSDAR